ncbi:MAG TPA: hypothetical protein P5229_01390 [Candidatus Gracilibacteria bacterium]|nr:hypothetical protein [Candidatus Gracilibacteria bacterium]
MNLNLSWDLFILVFFGVVIAYSFIIGRNQTLKVITATYIGILCADGLGNLFARYFASSDTFLKVLKLFAITSSEQAVAFFKVLILIVMIVIIAVRGLYSYDAEDGGPISIKLGISLVLGLLSAGLMMSALLIFVSGNSLVSSIFVIHNPLTEIYAQSRLVRIMLDFSNIWFLLPGLGIVLLSILHKK